MIWFAGFSQGYHDLTYGFCFTSSYMPPMLQEHLNPDEEALRQFLIPKWLFGMGTVKNM